MVQKSVIRQRIEKIDQHIQKITPYQKLSLPEFCRDSLAQDVVEYNIFQIVNHLIDMAEHIVVDEGYGLPSSAYEAIQILTDLEVFNQTQHALMRKMIGFRNVVGHDYLDLDKSVVHSILTSHISDILFIVSTLAERFLR